MENQVPFYNKRRFSRIAFDTKINLVSAERTWASQLVDISLKGMLATLPQNWNGKVGDHYLAEILLGDQETVIRMEVSVTHISKQNAGFHCELIDLDSISHLRRLIELNIGDESILNRELSELGDNTPK
ncbi:PilZ domain-containing protein [Kaarinaea lacus]